MKRAGRVGVHSAGGLAYALPLPHSHCARGEAGGETGGDTRQRSAGFTRALTVVGKNAAAPPRLATEALYALPHEAHRLALVRSHRRSQQRVDDDRDACCCTQRGRVSSQTHFLEDEGTANRGVVARNSGGAACYTAPSGEAKRGDDRSQLGGWRQEKRELRS